MPNPPLDWLLDGEPSARVDLLGQPDDDAPVRRPRARGPARPA